MEVPVLTIAGSDPSGGAGIQADLKTFTSHGLYGMAVITSLTAQNTIGVQSVHKCPADFTKAQLTAVLEDIPPKAIKTGMLGDAETVRAVVSSLSPPLGGHLYTLVVDPVMVSTSGHRLLSEDAVADLIEQLLPLATIVTPNIAEAEIILNVVSGSSEQSKGSIENIGDMKNAAKAISDLMLTRQGPDSSRQATRSNGAVMLKGGHIQLSVSDIRSLSTDDKNDCTTDWSSAGEFAPDFPLILKAAIRQSRSPSSTTLDKTGDELYSLRPSLARDIINTWHWVYVERRHRMRIGIVQAVQHAISYTQLGIATAKKMGGGHGPLNHTHSSSSLGPVLPPPTQHSPFPFVASLIGKCRRSWEHYVKHLFVKQLGLGTLPRTNFQKFIEQDYIYLKYYARAHGMLAAKSTSYEAMTASATIMLHIARESQMHEEFCASFGVSKERLDSVREDSATTAYGSYLLEVALRGDVLDLQAALLACLIGYGEVGLWLVSQMQVDDVSVNEGERFHIEGNPYAKWMNDYSGEEYQAACATGIRVLEEQVHSSSVSPEKLSGLSAIFERCVNLEENFWDNAMS